MIDDNHKEFIINNVHKLVFNDRVFKHNIDLTTISGKYNDNLIISCNIVKWGCNVCTFRSLCFSTDLDVINEVHDFLLNEVPEILL